MKWISHAVRCRLYAAELSSFERASHPVSRRISIRVPQHHLHIHVMPLYGPESLIDSPDRPLSVDHRPPCPHPFCGKGSHQPKSRRVFSTSEINYVTQYLNEMPLLDHGPHTENNIIARGKYSQLFFGKMLRLPVVDKVFVVFHGSQINLQFLNRAAVCTIIHTGRSPGYSQKHDLHKLWPIYQAF